MASKKLFLHAIPVSPPVTTAGTGVEDMRSQVSAQSHLEYRPSGVHWRRRWPRRVLKIWTPSKKIALLFPLRSHVLPDAKVLAQKLALLSDIAFAGVTERTMAIAPDIMERLLVELCRFLIEAADVAREMAPSRTPEVAAYELACANAAVETLRHAIASRDRERARQPLREVALRLGIALDEADPDWQRLAFRALRVMLDAEQENLRRDQGDFGGPSPAFQTARSLLDGGTPSAVVQPLEPLAHPAPIMPPAMPAMDDASTIATAASKQPHDAPRTGFSPRIEVAADEVTPDAKASKAMPERSCPTTWCSSWLA
ncbi:hypothetical protein [Limimaricola sp. AA108-03]|uniref:hypothetical protein n=1 Tax=Limimaricola sp. AA108-03 TaxID=3425945 RepID=UPI003D779D71